ncbi:MAG: hypothetical protein ACREMV_07040 [Gemmatimonadales bacterium]
MPAWVGVVTAISLGVIALAIVGVTVALVRAARQASRFFKLFEQLAGPAVNDARQMIGAIRAETESLVGTARDIRLRIVRAADAAEARLADVDALIDVVQEEVEDTALDVAAGLRKARRGLSLWQWGNRLIEGRRSRSKTRRRR